MSEMKSFIILLLLPCWVMAQNYCSISKDHTMCKYQRSGPTCGSDKESGVSAAEIQQILDLHNYYRAKIATGMENRGSPGPQPSAANMQQLIWDDNLAQVAQKWADQCMFQHDKCRDDLRFDVGQNMYFSSGFSSVDWSRAISAWYEEVPKFNSQTVNSFEFEPKVGHYTQLVWGNTRYIGCGRVTYGGAYRVEGYQRMEYVLSSSPRNQSVNDTEDKNRRRTDILPDLHDISPTLSDSVEDFVDEEVTQSFTSTFITQSLEEKNVEQSTVENSTEDIPTTVDIEKGQIITPSTSKNAGENISGETTVKSTTENFAEVIDQSTAEVKDISPNQDSSTNNTDHKFTIFIPGYWISNSMLNSNGQVSGSFQSIEFAKPGDLNTFIKETPSTGALKIASWNSKKGQWDVASDRPTLNLPTENPALIEVRELTQKGWVQNKYEKLGRDQILVCNYGPAGNYLFQPIYLKGTPCSKCPTGYNLCRNGLCA